MVGGGDKHLKTDFFKCGFCELHFIIMKYMSEVRSMWPQLVVFDLTNQLT